ncbi:hypothetical protein B566_EDAN009617, partial [Ephemera danica]
MTGAIEDLRSHFSIGDVLAACRALDPRTQCVLDVQIERVSCSIPGFLSLMLRVTATTRLLDSSVSQVKLIMKTQPEHAVQRKIVEDSERCPQLPLVDCLLAHETTLVLRDLSDAGYQSYFSGMEAMMKGTMSMPHIKFVLRRLAQMHAASLGTDWLKLMPVLQRDIMLQGAFSKTIMNPLKSGSQIAAMAIEQLFPDKRYAKHAAWLRHETHLLDTMTALATPAPGKLNVLCHGDLHLNNMMFLHDPDTAEPRDVKFFDLQLFRFSRPCVELHYFFMAGTNKEFLVVQHEQEILKTYVEAFNAAACTTPDLMNFDAFLTEYNESRIFGLAFEMMGMPMKFQTDLMPQSGEALREDQFEAWLLTDHSGTAEK